VHTDDFDFELPTELIAQHPPANRGDSRLLLVPRHHGEFTDAAFSVFPSCLQKGDVLVLNASTVVPARLLGTKQHSGGAVELLLIRPVEHIDTAAALNDEVSRHVWLCLGRASKPIRVGAQLNFESHLSATVLSAPVGGEFHVRFTSTFTHLSQALDACGKIPLPPYVTRAPTEEDKTRYQTVFAQKPGSVAAPTAGLHLTQPVLAQIESQGVQVVTLALDIGPGTFRPVREGTIENHVMHEERYVISQQTAQAVNQAQREGRRVIAVGTTVVRALESSFGEHGRVHAGAAATSIFMTPGFEFRVVQGLLTNFHLPKSTLLMLVSAFAGRERMLSAYAHAVARGYRFFSYGDAMFIA
jgi:S-adenosylmethionine:tRNA ribosyltransferase-isomerase